MQTSSNREFFELFQAQVLLEVDQLLNLNLESKSYRINLYPSREDEKRIRELARACMKATGDTTTDFIEWFAVAYVAGLAWYCHQVNNKILIRTSFGYEDWTLVADAYPLEYLRKKIEERRLTYEAAERTNPSLSIQMLETPIVVRDASNLNSDIAGLVAEKDLMKYLCPALKGVADDVIAVAIAITPILLTLIIAGTITIPMAPPLMAAISLFISRIGINVLCADYPVGKESKK